MRLVSMMAAASLAAMAGAGAAQSAPSASAMVQPAVDSGPAPTLELVRGGCGFGAHRTYYGGCHLNYGWRGRLRAWHWYHRW